MRKPLVLIVTFMGGLFFVAVFSWYFVFWPRLEVRNTVALIAVINEALEICRAETGWEPSRDGAEIAKVLLGENVRDKTYLDPQMKNFLNERGEFVDSWNVSLEFARESEDTWVVRSAGKNGVFGDSDDLTSDDFFSD